MIFTKIKRTIKDGFVGFWRNGFLSFASIVVLTLTLTTFGGLIFFNGLTQNYLNDIKGKVDINVYFSLNAAEADILALRETIEDMPEVSKVEYVSREQALADFKERHKDDALILQGLEEIGENPLPASFNIQAKDPSRYESVLKFLQSSNALNKNGNAIVEKVSDNKKLVVINRLGSIIKMIEKIGLGLTGVLVIVAIIVTLNTIRLVIYSRREEVAVMKLVGASNAQIRGPFVVSGVMCGIFAAALALLIMYPIAYYAVRVTNAFSSDFTLLGYYIANFGQIFIMIMVAGIILGGISSYVAVRKYLKV